MKAMRLAGGLALATAIALHPPAFAQSGRAATDHWVGTWATAPVARPPQGQGQQGRGQGQGGGGAAAGQAAPSGQAPRPISSFNNQTIRQIVHTSVGGQRVRVVLSNVFGTAPLGIGSAHVALRDKDAAIVAKSDRVLTFGGNAAVTIPPGAVIVSDPADLAVPALSDLAIDIFVPGDTASMPSPLTTHNGARQTNYVSDAGNHAGAANLPVSATTAAWFFLARVEVTAPEQTRALVTFGDSITDGYNSTPNTNNRWPDHFAKRLMAQASGKMGVLNLGIDGNRVLADGQGVSALARFDRDVLAQTGVTHVFVLEGINDVGLARETPKPTVEDIIAGHRQLIRRAHAHGLKIYSGTMLPFEGTTIPNYYSPDGEKIRQAFNQWMRTSKEYDAFVDFDAMMRDPGQPGKMLAQYDSGDHLHPNDAGYEAMAKALNLELFKAGKK